MGADWNVYASWQATNLIPAVETRTPCPDWPTARRQARSLACLSGVRYVSVQGPGDWVVGDYDRYTNRWREYTFPLGRCGNELEPDGEVCTAELGARCGALQVKCPRCGAWHGVHSRTEWRAWQVVPVPEQTPDPARVELVARALAEPARTCGHCREPMRGYASVGDTWLCHPDDGLDCYRLVTVYKHPTPCFQCASIHYGGDTDD